MAHAQVSRRENNKRKLLDPEYVLRNNETRKRNRLKNKDRYRKRQKEFREERKERLTDWEYAAEPLLEKMKRFIIDNEDNHSREVSNNR